MDITNCNKKLTTVSQINDNFACDDICMHCNHCIHDGGVLMCEYSDLNAKEDNNED